MAEEVRFAADLYRGTAAAYERYRLPYPAAMTADLVRSAQVSGRGRLLDLACGTGQLAFPLRGWFAEVWAVDQEPDMVEVVRAKAATAGARISGRWCRARRRSAPSRSTSSWPSSATRSTGWTGIWPLAGSSAGSSQVAAWRCAGLPCPGTVSKAGSGLWPPPWTGGKRRSAPSDGSRLAGKSAIAQARLRGAIRRRIRAGRKS